MKRAGKGPGTERSGELRAMTKMYKRRAAMRTARADRMSDRDSIVAVRTLCLLPACFPGLRWQVRQQVVNGIGETDG